jgi:hypothetical protein
MHISSGIPFSLQNKRDLSFEATWMNPEDIMLSEVSQAQKDKCCMISPIIGNNRNKMNRSRE